MFANFGVLLDKAAHEIAPRFTTGIRFGTAAECGFRSSFVTAPPCRQENDCREQVVRTQGRKQDRWRQLWHVEFHKSIGKGKGVNGERVKGERTRGRHSILFSFFPISPFPFAPDPAQSIRQSPNSAYCCHSAAAVSACPEVGMPPATVPVARPVWLPRRSERRVLLQSTKRIRLHFRSSPTTAADEFAAA